MKYIFSFFLVFILALNSHARRWNGNDFTFGDTTTSEKTIHLGKNGQNIIMVPSGGGDIEFSNDGGFTFKTIGSGGGSTGSLNSVQIADGSNNFIGDSDFTWDPGFNELTVLGDIKISGTIGSDTNPDNFYRPDSSGVSEYASSGSIIFSIDRDNNQTDRIFQWLRNNSTAIMTLNEIGDLVLSIGKMSAASGFITDATYAALSNSATDFYSPDSGGSGVVASRGSFSILIDQDNNESVSIFQIVKDAGVTFLMQVDQSGNVNINGGEYRVSGNNIERDNWRTLNVDFPILCTFTVTNSAGTPVLTSHDGCITGLVDHSIGQWTFNLTGFTTITGCKISGVATNADAGCHIHSFSTSAIRILCVNPSTATPSDITVSGSCSGT